MRPPLRSDAGMRSRRWPGSGVPLLLSGLAALVAPACTSPPYQASRVPHAGNEVPPDVEYWSGKFKGDGDLDIFEQGWRPSGNARAAVVLIHGIKDYSGRYRELGTTLAGRGIAVYALDLRGHGYSAGVRDHLDSLESVMVDLSTLVARVRDRQPGKPIFLLGQGVGASLAGVYVLREKPAVAGLMLSAPLIYGEVKRSERVGTRAAAILGPRTHQQEVDLGKWSSDPTVVAALKNDSLIYDGPLTAGTVGELLRASDELTEHEADLKVPLLVLSGSADQVASPERARALEEAAGTTDKEWKSYDGLAHDLFHEPRRDEVITDVIAWVGAHAAVKNSEPPSQSPGKKKPPIKKSRTSARSGAPSSTP